MSLNEKKQNKEEQIKELVIARIKAKMSSNLRLSVGEEGSFNSFRCLV